MEILSCPRLIFTCADTANGSSSAGRSASSGFIWAYSNAPRNVRGRTVAARGSPRAKHETGLVETTKRNLPVGGDVEPGGGVHFRVWAPQREKVSVVLESGPGAPASIPLVKESDGSGYFSAFCAQAAAGTNYRYELDDDAMRYPDPASRFQPDGPHGSSQVVDPAAFAWTDSGWSGVEREGHIIYEMHVGTFSQEGTWNGARNQLQELAGAGITLIEVMPVADFPG